LAILLDMTREHVPVLVAELVELIDPRPGETIVDCTFGAGGHARLVAERLGSEGTLVCVDRDPVAAERYAAFAAEAPCRTHFVRADYADALGELAADGERVDAVYLDLGVSSMQLDTLERGFSYAYEAPLDMRMDPGGKLDARTVVNEWDERRLAGLFREYGEERYAGQIARGLVRRRRRAPLETTAELVEVINESIPAPARFGAGHPARRVFQAIRLAVNHELASLDRALPVAWSILRPGGRLAAISFHSLEDRRVKRFLRDRARGCVCPPELPICVCGREPEAELLASGGVTPSRAEVEDNPRARPARLRGARRIEAAGADGDAS
jgi:16S rRNA (cytosine1402-N4)-methyltransferase